MKTFAWPKYDIVKNINGKEEVYLRRYFIFRSKYFNIYLHNIRFPDDDEFPHTHPWNFFSLMLNGGYLENVYYPEPIDGKVSVEKTNIRKGISLEYREAACVHKIIKVLPSTWTLVCTGKVQKDWGFLTNDGWVYWRKFLNIWEKVDMD